MFYTPIPSIKPRSTHVNPKICVFSPFLAFFALERQNYPPPAEKTATEAHRRPNSPAAPSRPSALRSAACPFARPLGLAPLWARGRGVCSAPFGQLHPAVVPPACAPCSSLPSASNALLMRLYELSCADGKEWAANNRALVPPGLRRRRPPRRRFAVRWRGRAVSGARGGGQLLPRPLAASPSSVWSAWPLAALSHASARRAGAWPLRPVGAAAARLRPLASAVSRRLVLRRPLWRVLVAANAVFFSPLTTPLFSPWRWRAAMRKISVRGAKNSCAPARLKTGGLVAGVARALAAFAATVRKRSASRPLAVRAPLAAPCAPSAPFGARRPRRLVVRREW